MSRLAQPKAAAHLDRDATEGTMVSALLTDSAQTIFDAACTRWHSLQPLQLPPPSPVVLWQESSRTLYVEDELGAAVPYPPIPRVGSESNHGYVRLKGNLSLVEAVPELADWPEFAHVVRSVNSESSRVESIGCAIGFFEVAGHPTIKHRVGAYLDVVLSDPIEAQEAEAYLRVAAALMSCAIGCERWWASFEAGLQRMRYLPETTKPLGLMLRFSGHGPTAEEARHSIGETFLRMAEGFRSDSEAAA